MDDIHWLPFAKLDRMTERPWRVLTTTIVEDVTCAACIDCLLKQAETRSSG